MTVTPTRVSRTKASGTRRAESRHPYPAQSASHPASDGYAGAGADPGRGGEARSEAPRSSGRPHTPRFRKEEVLQPTSVISPRGLVGGPRPDPGTQGRTLAGLTAGPAPYGPGGYDPGRSDGGSYDPGSDGARLLRCRFLRCRLLRAAVRPGRRVRLSTRRIRSPSGVRAAACRERSRRQPRPRAPPRLRDGRCLPARARFRGGPRRGTAVRVRQPAAVRGPGQWAGARIRSQPGPGYGAGAGYTPGYGPGPPPGQHPGTDHFPVRARSGAARARPVRAAERWLLPGQPPGYYPPAGTAPGPPRATYQVRRVRPTRTRTARPYDPGYADGGYAYAINESEEFHSGSGG